MPLIGAPLCVQNCNQGKTIVNKLLLFEARGGHSPLRLMMLRGSGSLSVTATLYKSSPKKGPSHQNAPQISR